MTFDDWKIKAQKRLIELEYTHHHYEPEQYPSPDSHQEREKQRDAVAAWVWDKETARHFSHALDYQPGWALTDEKLHANIEKIAAVLNREAYGRHWHKRKPEVLTRYIAFCERGPKSENRHGHVLATLPSRLDLRPFVLNGEVTKVCRRMGICGHHGDVKFALLGNPDDVMRELSYMLKASWNGISMSFSGNL